MGGDLGVSPGECARAVAEWIGTGDPSLLQPEHWPGPWAGVARACLGAEPGNRGAVFSRICAGLAEGGAEMQRAVLQAHRAEDAPQPRQVAQGYHCTDMGNAERFVAQHGQDLRFCFPLDTWFYWNGARWECDDTGEIERRAKETVRQLYVDAGQLVDPDQRKALAKWVIRSESANRLKAMTQLARSEIPVLVDAFDADPWQLNVVNGTVDLCTGALSAHRREDLITQLSPVRYDPDATLPLWQRFLDETTGGDRELQAYLQRAVGYTLTGRTDDETLFFVHGPTRTGKSTFLEALKGALGDYAKVADFGTFLRGHTVGRPRADIARLRGARLVVSIEVDEGSALAEALIKALTGGDTVTARALYRDAFEFRPSFKLWLAANAAPKVSDRDGAIWQRIRRIPFYHEIPAERRDPGVKERLRDPEVGGPALLAWAVQGCLAWQREGLGTCAAVETSTAEYRGEQNPLREFVSECCVLAPGAWVSSKRLRECYDAWADEQGVRWAVRGSEWGERLRELGCERESRRKGDRVSRGWGGIGLRDDPVQAEL